jgi:hypothetical protein
MDFLYASAEVHTLPPRKRLGCVLREVAHSPVDLGSKKARLVGESYVKLALGDPRLAGKALDLTHVNDSGDDADTRETGGSYGTFKAKGGARRNASTSSLQTTEHTAKKKKKLTTKSERAGGNDEDDDDDGAAKEPKELTDEEMAMKLHMEMNASPRISRGARSASAAGKPTVLFG